MKPRVIYVSYDGMLEPLGQSQVLAYLEKLRVAYDFHIVSFEKKADRADAGKVAAMRRRLAAAGIGWTMRSYHKRPSALATAWDILVGMVAVLWLTVRRRAAIAHARSYVPALMVLPAKRLTRIKFLFDIRGFWADERVDGGLWPRDGALYRVTKNLERRFFLAADHVVTLTEASKAVIAEFPYLKDKPPITVIPTCADLDRFALRAAPPPEPFTFGYVGSIGTWYLFDETMRFFRALLVHEPEARFLIVNRHEHALIRATAEKFSVDPARLTILAAEHRDVPGQVRQMHAAAALIKPCFSKIASAPTKLAEYLGCGVPCLGNAGVGDMERIVEGMRAGVLLREFSDAAMDQAASRLVAIARDPDTAAVCRKVAVSVFSLDAGVTAYDHIFRELTNAA